MVQKPKRLQVLGEFSVACDTELSLESEKPVQNKVITSALDKKIETLRIAKNTDIDKLFI